MIVLGRVSPVKCVIIFILQIYVKNEYIYIDRRLYTWTSPDGQNRNQIDYILCSQRWRSIIQSAKKRPGADCGSDHELLIAKCRLKLKKVGKTTRSFRYDLNHLMLSQVITSHQLNAFGHKRFFTLKKWLCG